MEASETARHIVETLKAAQHEPPATALASLNGLVELTKEASEISFEIDEARAGSFMAICEVAKALHRGTPVEALWPAAIRATEHWSMLLQRRAARAVS